MYIYIYIYMFFPPRPEPAGRARGSVARRAFTERRAVSCVHIFIIYNRRNYYLLSIIEIFFIYLFIIYCGDELSLACIYLSIYIFLSLSLYIYMSISIYLCIYIYIYMYTYIHITHMI